MTTTNIVLICLIAVNILWFLYVLSIEQDLKKIKKGLAKHEKELFPYGDNFYNPMGVSDDFDNLPF